ncbi:tyrosine-type recombinase/integrase [Clostridium sp.]|uniref:tyrosine-type recombinase/integrase n=1 Tax=Clostridium sp. TaxID=1506 RepID=UPI0035A10054
MNVVEPIKNISKVQQILRYAKQHNERDYVMLELGFHTGLRISDILKLKIGDIQDKKGNIKKYLVLREGKTNKFKRIKLNPEVRDCLKNYCKGKEAYEYLIKSRQHGEHGNKPITRQRAYQIIIEIGGMLGIEDLGCHSLRKTFGYLYYKKTKDIALLQRLFNHSSQFITLRYIGVEQQALDKALDDMNFGV